MIIGLIVLGAVLLIVGAFIPPPGKNVCNIAGGIMVAVGLVLLILGALSGGPIVVRTV